jgi:hypothetical protein
MDYPVTCPIKETPAASHGRCIHDAIEVKLKRKGSVTIVAPSNCLFLAGCRPHPSRACQERPEFGESEIELELGDSPSEAVCSAGLRSASFKTIRLQETYPGSYSML